MTQGVPTKVIAACCGLTAFAVAIIAGLAIGNPADVVLGRALSCMVVCQLLGLVIGAIGERTIAEAARKSAGPGTSGESGMKSTSGGDDVLLV